MASALYAFDVDDCLEMGGEFRLPSSSGPVTIASIRAEISAGNMAAVVGNWTNLPSVLLDWREVFSYLLPPVPGESNKAFWLAWLRSQHPDCGHYVMVGNDPRHHRFRPAYWDRDYPGTLPVRHIPGESLLSNDYAAAQASGFEFLREDQWAAGQRRGPVPPPDPSKPSFQFPKHTRRPMLYKSFKPEILKADDAKGIVEAIVSVTGNKDHQDEVIDPGAWRPAIDHAAASGRMPKITMDHRWAAATTIGKTLAMEEWLPADPRLPDSLKSKGYGGLWVRGQFNLDKQVAREAYSDLKFDPEGSEFSVGFDVDTDADGKKCEGAEDGVAHIKAIKPLYEWSKVFMGANELTAVAAVKAANAPARLTEAAFEALSDEEKLGIFYSTLGACDPSGAAYDDNAEDIPGMGIVDEATRQLAKWSRAFINRLPDSAFALVLPGGTKDATGRTQPRSLRKLPHHGPGGAVDKPHLSNALSRAAQQPALKKAIPHLRKHANAIGMGKGLEEADYAQDTLDADHVTEAILKNLGTAVGASVVEAVLARRTKSM